MNQEDSEHNEVTDKRRGASGCGCCVNCVLCTLYLWQRKREKMSHSDAIQDASKLADAHDKPCVLVPIVRATPESLIGYGTLVSDFHAEDIIRVTWPRLTGSRPIVPGTGNHQVRHRPLAYLTSPNKCIGSIA